MVESQPSKLLVASSILVSRSMFSMVYKDLNIVWGLVFGLNGVQVIR